MKTPNIAIFPGTFDPITLGHIAILEKAQNLFDKIIVAVATGHHKNPLCAHEKRIELCRNALKKFLNIEVLGFSGLLIEFAKLHEVNWLIRGVRNAADFTFEAQLAGMNRIMNSNLETMFILAADKYQHVSSSMVREIIRLEGDVTQFVPQNILELLQKS